jgi:hypothetical protein
MNSTPTGAAGPEDAGQPNSAHSSDKEERGRLYWLFRNLIASSVSWMKKHWIVASALVVFLLYQAFVQRSSYQFAFLFVRQYVFFVVLGIGLICLYTWQMRKRGWLGKIGWSIVAVILIAGVVFVSQKPSVKPYEYLSLYYRYKVTDMAELSQLPTTDYERVQPLQSIHNLARDAISGERVVTSPDFVRQDSLYRWTMAVEPKHFWQKTLTQFEVAELLNVSATTPSPSFSSENRHDVFFDVGEGLKFSHETETAVIRNLGLLQFFSYEPGQVRYMKNDAGEFVQVVSLIKWSGFLFPYPEFGGVVVIPQGDTGPWYSSGAWQRRLFGVGEWISPADINEYDYLRGQNLLPEQVSRYIARSMKFQEGILAPMPGYHYGDIRVPDRQADGNRQPFTAYFDFSRNRAAESSKLYQYFALEPYDRSNHGLNTSLFVPADGQGSIYVYSHHEKDEGLIGVSAVSEKIRDSKKNYSWEQSIPVEHRPYIKQLGGEIRFFWLTTIVTKQDATGDRDTGEFTGGTIPEIVITEAAYKRPVWVDADEKAKWNAMVVDELSRLWK